MCPLFGCLLLLGFTTFCVSISILVVGLCPLFGCLLLLGFTTFCVSISIWFTVLSGLWFGCRSVMPMVMIRFMLPLGYAKLPLGEVLPYMAWRIFFVIFLFLIYDYLISCNSVFLQVAPTDPKFQRPMFATHIQSTGNNQNIYISNNKM